MALAPAQTNKPSAKLGSTKKLTRVLGGVFARFDYNDLVALVIEPDEESRDELVGALVDLGFPRPKDAHNAATALYAAEEISPSFIILDSRLDGPDGGTDGFELLQRIREDETTIAQDVPVILLAGSVSEFTIAETKRLGVDMLLTKPVPMKRFQMRVNGLMMKRFPDHVSWG